MQEEKGGPRQLCPQIKRLSHGECKSLRGKHEFDFSIISVSLAISCSTTRVEVHCVVITPLHNSLESDKLTYWFHYRALVLTTTSRTPIDSAATPLRADTTEQKLNLLAQASATLVLS